MKDPIQEYVDWLRQHAIDLNTNIEAIKVFMSVQCSHNQIFIEDIKDLKERIEIMEQNFWKEIK